jgi:succinyl-CoA synthetase alpha subunit
MRSGGRPSDDPENGWILRSQGQSRVRPASWQSRHTVSILVGDRTGLLIQGITGREASMMTQHMLRYGTRIVAGVTPGKGGRQVGPVPVFDTVRDALANAEAPIDTTLVYVPPASALAAVEEACAAGLRLIVVITERIPQRDVCRMLAVARAAGAEVVGPNSVGVITPGERVNVGPIGGDDPSRCYQPGRMGIISRSGGMTGECAWMMRQVGLGVSTAVSVGGDPIVGFSAADALRAFQADPDTDAVLLYAEPGTPYEEEAADLLLTGEFTKPLVAFLAGHFVDALPHGTMFGHTAAIVDEGRGLVSTKARRLREAGAVVVKNLNDIPGCAAKIAAARAELLR